MNPDRSQNPPALHIGRLRLRIPGADADAGNAFARQFTEELASHSDGLGPTHIGALRMRVEAPADTQDPGTGTIASHAARAVVARLNSHSHSQNQNHA